MNVARLNFSHGDHEGHGATLDRLREALATRPGVHVAVMLDTKGPEIRTGFLGSAKTMEYKKGSIVEIVTDYSMPGNSEIIACSYSDLPTTTKVGATILVADGSLVLKVTELRSSSVMAEVGLRGRGPGAGQRVWPKYFFFFNFDHEKVPGKSSRQL
jgi:pyruvate kinase